MPPLTESSCQFPRCTTGRSRGGAFSQSETKASRNLLAYSVYYDLEISTTVKRYANGLSTVSPGGTSDDQIVDGKNVMHPVKSLVSDRASI